MYLQRAMRIYFDDLHRFFKVAKSGKLTDDIGEVESKVFHALTILERQFLILTAHALCARLPHTIVADLHEVNALPSQPSCRLDSEGRLHLGRNCTAEGVECHLVICLANIVAGIDGAPETLGLQLDLHEQGLVVVVGLGQDRVCGRTCLGDPRHDPLHHSLVVVVLSSSTWRRPPWSVTRWS